LSIVLEIHLVIAYLVLLLAIFVGWVPMGRRVMVGIIGLQVVVGLIVAGMWGASHRPLPPEIIAHILGAIAAMLAYVFARRFGDRGNKNAALILSAVGLLVIVGTIWLGFHMAGRV
jgi:uncharacterized protein YacL